ncbi:unnamed protein product [Zymoseptoria tritici ST99CH_1E4]|uniref:Uncharacterized protein n=1 Tax=Zymoseptoria tritici ST99CH_1E4 TaxID=1276532 RepID=A0A2H1FXR4_ZYMTR|nr:unnamed protein product [Zymoseptoria tritici ST99CH_1E4]
MPSFTTILTLLAATAITFTTALPSPHLFTPRAPTNVTVLNAGVNICTEPDFGGECYHSSWPKNTCIDLRGYAGVTRTFLPDTGFDCLLMQNKCDASVPFADISSDETEIARDLSGLKWIGNATSYICFSEVVAAKRFIRISRLKASGGMVRAD